MPSCSERPLSARLSELHSACVCLAIPCEGGLHDVEFMGCSLAREHDISRPCEFYTSTGRRASKPCFVAEALHGPKEYPLKYSLQSVPLPRVWNPAPDGRSAPWSRCRCGRAASRSPAASSRAPGRGTRSCDGGFLCPGMGFPNPRIPDGSPFGMQETAGDRQGSEMLPIPVAVIDKVAEQRTSGLKCRADSGDTGGKRSRGQGKTQIQSCTDTAAQRRKVSRKRAETARQENCGPRYRRGRREEGEHRSAGAPG